MRNFKVKPIFVFSGRISHRRFFYESWRIFSALFSVLVMGSLCFALYLSSQLPDRYYLAKGETFSIGDNKMITGCQQQFLSSFCLFLYREHLSDGFKTVWINQH